MIVTGHFHEHVGYGIERDHGSNDWLLIYTVSGMGRFTHRGGSYNATAHNLTLLAPHTYQIYETHPEGERWELLWAHFAPPEEWLAWLRWPVVSPQAPGFMRLTLTDPVVQRHVRRSLAQAHRALQSYMRHRDAMAMNALESALLWADEQNPESARHRMDPRIRLAQDYLCRNLAEPISLDSLAKECGLSASRLSHLFAEQVRTSPQRFLEQQRINRARQLLELTGHSVAEVALEVGYDNPFYFTRRFKAATGQSPRDYRNGFNKK